MSCNQYIAVDAMGGDAGPSVSVPATLQSLHAHPDLFVHLVGEQKLIQPFLAKCENPQVLPRVDVVHTSCAVSDLDKPSKVIRDKVKSSMYRAVELVKQGHAQACVSAGNTGSLLLCGRHLLKTLPGIDKPAIVATISGATEPFYLLDVGANMDCKAEDLFQFATMGSVMAATLKGQSQPRVGLLNIGVEDYKGSEQVIQAAHFLEHSKAINYVGFIEGSALFEGEADVVVCDGFAGNVTIKTSAGVVKVVNEAFNQSISAGVLSSSATAELEPLLQRLRQRINPSQFNGASLLGLKGSIVKSHGNASIEGFVYAIEQAIKEAGNNIPQLIAEKVAGIIENP